MAFEPEITAREIARAGTLYTTAISQGCTGLREHVGTGKTSAISRVMEWTGWSRTQARERILRAIGEPLPKAANDDQPEAAAPQPEPPPANLPDLVLSAIKRHSLDADEMAAKFKCAPSDITDALYKLRQNSVRVSVINGKFAIIGQPLPAPSAHGAAFSFKTEADNTFTFGACGDQHAGSKYERIDVWESLYTAYADEGCSIVFNTGNWIDGEARFNLHDLHTHGMHAQVKHLAQNYPRRAGIETFAVAGDDHEGWYAQRDGVDIGRYAERTFRDEGRNDWHDLGYMEAPIRIVNANTGKAAIGSVVHPGGGSAYALSYSIQKIIESLDGGEKPAFGLYGHYHKLWYGNIRNVFCVQTGCGQDQTPFMRKKRLEAHVGGTIVKLTQDPATGAIVRCRVEILRYFNKDYYRNRWSSSGGVFLPPRTLNGVA